MLRNLSKSSEKEADGQTTPKERFVTMKEAEFSFHKNKIWRFVELKR